jgi:uncharacterized protein YecE (DUF72 family)
MSLDNFVKMELDRTTNMSYLLGGKIGICQTTVKRFLSGGIMGPTSAKVRMGIGGWEHEILDAVFYGRSGLSSEEKLSRYARTFDTTVTRATFWDAELNGANAAAWVRAVRHNSSFRFVVKLHHWCTHEQKAPAFARQNLRHLLQVLDGEGRLGAVLAQFPFSFTNTSSNRFSVIRLAEIFSGFPLHVEFRHASWHQPSLQALFAEHQVRLASADLPRIRQFMPFQTPIPGSHTLLRMHGRNERGWLQNGLDARYDYLYNAREIIELRRRVESLIPSTREITVIFNNTTNGYAVANSLQLLTALHGGKPVTLPPPALAAFPQLRQIADPSGLEEGLFDSHDFRTAI